MIQVGDEILCIQDEDVPRFIGTVWTVTSISYTGSLYFCRNLELTALEDYPFTRDEIVPVSSLVKELI
jgi:hypothetical protein